MNRRVSTAIVRAVPDSFDRAIRPQGGAPIDVDLARTQHDAYVRTLEGTGLRVRRIRADDRYPDCCFVEDPAIVVEDIAVILRSAAPSRRGEETAVERALARHTYVLRMQAPAHMDGGDMVRVGGRLFVGLTTRTNTEAVQQLRYSLGGQFMVTPVEVRGALHLKSACSHVAGDTLLIDPESVDPDAFAGYTALCVPDGERYAANCLSVNGTVVVPAGHPGTRDLLAEEGERAGFRVVELDMSEFRKAGGSLTCLSLLV